MDKSFSIVIRVLTREPDSLRMSIKDNHPEADVVTVSSMSGAETVFLVGLSALANVASILSLIHALASRPVKSSSVTLIYIQDSEGKTVAATDKFSDDEIKRLLDQVINGQH